MTRNILITGGTGRIAKEIISGLLKDGHTVIFTSRSKSSIDFMVNSEYSQYDQLYGVELDLLTVDKFGDWVKKLPFRADTIIHNARNVDSLRNDENGNATFKHLQDEFNMAITMPYLLSNAFLVEGHPIQDIIFISSMYGTVAPTPHLYDDFLRQSPIQYGVSKAAQIHLTKELAVRLSTRGIRVNCISYGGVEGRVDLSFKEKYNKLNPLNRMLNNADLYPPIQYVVNNPNLAITGENIKVDGGWTIW